MKDLNWLKFGCIRAIGLLCAVAIGWSMMVLPAQASFCRQVNDRQVCILDIKRSAKNYWQYQAVTSINGVRQPTAVYDCRDRSIYEADGSISSFRSNPTGSIVCSLYRRN
jgi:hypothetical protein